MTHVEQRRARPEKETIHSGHFMVSHFEAEAQDDDDLAAVPVPDEESGGEARTVTAQTLQAPPSNALVPAYSDLSPSSSPQQISIETSLTKLFKCMTLAYRQKLTSPKWNRFKGIKLRWKDKIRLNNVIWRCWHMQFIKRKNTLVCQFASPLDVDIHVKPETTILEGKYWKRRAEAVKAEYKKWRMFHMRRLLGRGDSSTRDMVSDMDVETFSLCGDMAGNMLMDEDYIAFMSDTLFSTITSNQPFAFPDTREIARGASLADFIQPSLGPLQPNLDDFMDTLEPLQELLSQSRLPPVPEEPPAPPDEHAMFRADLYAYGLPPAPPAAAAAAAAAAAGHSSSAAAAAAVAALHIGSGGGARMLPAPENMHAGVKGERVAYDAAALYAPPDPHPHTHPQPHPQPHPSAYQPPQHAYDARTTHVDTRALATFGGKAMRSAYTTSPKILPHPDTAYTKSYNTQVLTPSQTAPETVSLLQQGGGGGGGGGAGGRGAYQRERASRPRIAQYTSQLPHQAPSPHFQPYATPTQHHPQQYDAQPQYLSAALDGYTKPSARPYKLPLQTITTISSQQSSAGTSRAPSLSAAHKESFRSNSLPLGAQLGADWSIAAPAAAAAHPAPSAPSVPHAATPQDITPRAARGGGVVRRRSRSSSGGGGGTAAAAAAGGAGGARRVPPPLASVASEPTLPQASVMLAQLLSSQHSQSMYKLNVSGEDMSPRAELRSPLAKQPSPADDTMASPLHSTSPGTSPPQSPSSPREPRRSTHQHAEQKRRYNIKNGFDTLQALIPHLNNNPAAKVSKAAMLQKGAEYIKQLKAERNQIKDEMESLRLQIECLNNSISNCHSLLPATGAPVSRARAGRLREMFARHVAARSLHNWKYWLFSVVATALVESFSNCVSCGSGADLVRSTLLWAEQHCSLVEMRPAVLSSLRVLCTTTDILTCPERLPEEARAAATRAAAIKAEPL